MTLPNSDVVAAITNRVLREQPAHFVPCSPKETIDLRQEDSSSVAGNLALEDPDGRSRGIPIDHRRYGSSIFGNVCVQADRQTDGRRPNHSYPLVEGAGKALTASTLRYDGKRSAHYAQ